MTVQFENYGNFYITFHYDDNTHDNYDGCGLGYNLKEAMDFIAQNMENGLTLLFADIVDATTEEIVAIVERDVEEYLEDWYDWHDEYDEIGYNPYMGCYDFDC